MNECPKLDAAVFFMNRIKSRSLTSFEPQGIEPKVTPDGSKFYLDSFGEISYARYSNGAIVSIHANNVTTRTADGDYWFVSSGGLSSRVD